MKICLCFLGLQRTFEKTHTNIFQSVFNPENIFSFVYFTWQSESTEVFQKILPQAAIMRVPDIDETNPEFLRWKEGLQMHISWRRTYEPTVALFRYFQQIYLWKKASEILQPHIHEFDLMIRLRTDVTYSSPIFPFYSAVQMKESPVVVFSKNPQQSIFGNEESCPDQFFMAKPAAFLKTLQIIDSIHSYKVSYLETNRKWFPEDKMEVNIVQPESTLYRYLKGCGIHIFYTPISIEVIRD